MGALKLMKTVTIHEIAPRDGLQNIKHVIPTEKKIKLIDMLVEAGVVCIESTAFVNPRWLPQMEDAREVCASACSHPGIRNSVLIPNMKGFELAYECGAREMVAFFSVSEIHNKRNVNKSVDESLEEIKLIGQRALDRGVVPRVNIATAFGYLEEEIISPERVLFIATSLEASGFAGITLCDTTGVAHPDQVYELCTQVRGDLASAKVAVHLHQNNGIEFANTYAAYKAGVAVFESAAGGLGGCPYAPEADGNIATEKLVKMFDRMGVDCGIDAAKLDAVSRYTKGLQLEYSNGQAVN